MNSVSNNNICDIYSLNDNIQNLSLSLAVQSKNGFLFQGSPPLKSPSGVICLFNGGEQMSALSPTPRNRAGRADCCRTPEAAEGSQSCV